MLVLLLPLLIRVISILDNNSLLMMSPFEYLTDPVSSLALDHGNQSRKSDDHTCNSNCIILSDTDVLVPCLFETMNPEPLVPNLLSYLSLLLGGLEWSVKEVKLTLT